MKRALVLTLLVLGLGVFAYAGPLTGSWDTDFCIAVQTDGTVTFSSLDSDLMVEYAVCGWAFGAQLDFGMDNGFEDVMFYAEGALGAFQFGTLVDFDPTGAGEFSLWNGYVELAIAGVDMYAFWGVAGDSVAGFTFGGSGTVGDCFLYAEANFGMDTALYDTFGATSPSSLFPAYFWDHNVYGISFFTPNNDCTATWDWLHVSAEFPFTCLDVVVDLWFNCTAGFDEVTFGMNDIDLGIDWLLLDDLDITFTTTTKNISIDIDVVALDTICVVPYFQLDFTDYVIEGIVLEAVELTYTWNGVTFIAAEIFGDYYSFYSYCSPTLSHYPIGSNSANEVIGIEVDGDSCCGGSFDAYVYNFFIFGLDDTDNTSKIFDWDHTCVGLTYGISSNVILDASLSVNTTGLQSLCFGFEFIW